MTDQNEPSTDYKTFLESGIQSNSEIAETLTGVRTKIQSKLVHSPSRLASTYVASSFVGYGASLFICAQNEVALSSLAQKTAASLCALPQPWCWVVCGLIFSLLPFLICAFVLGKFQHRYLLFKLWWLIALAPVVAATTMILVPNLARLSMGDESGGMMAMNSASSVSAWLVSAILAPYLLEAVCYFFLRQRKYPA